MELTSRSRPLTPEDLSRFDYVIGMDASNMAAIQVPNSSRNISDPDKLHVFVCGFSAGEEAAFDPL